MQCPVCSSPCLVCPDAWWSSRQTRQIEAWGTRWESLARQRWPQLAARGARRSRPLTLVLGRDAGDATGRAPLQPFMRSMRLGKEEDVVEQLLCPEMTRWRWSSTRRRSCGSGRGTSGGCAVQNAASPTLVWSKIAMPDGTTRLGRARGRAARAESLGVKRRPSHARCALLLSHDVMMTAYTLFFF